MLAVAAAQGSALINGTTTPSPAEDEELYDQLLRLRDAVIAGQHRSLRLSASAIVALKASLPAPDSAAPSSVQPQLNGISNSTTLTTDQSQLQHSLPFPPFVGLPGLQASPPSLPNGASQVSVVKPASSASLDPIFLEKADSLVRAEGQLKRQRLERELQAQVEQRKHASRDKDSGADASSPLNIDNVLAAALERVKPVSGLKLLDKPGSAVSSSFDENDYYSSQVQSDWPSEASSSKGSDRAAGAFTADFERFDEAPQAPNSHTSRAVDPRGPVLIDSSISHPKSRQYGQADDPEDEYNPEDEDDEYTPPDAAAFNDYRGPGVTKEVVQITPQEDDNSDYEPGEITQDSNIPTPNHYVQQPVQPSPRVQVVRNHLTHIAAPQPNRVSPLATAKGPSIELELVNGRPEVVQKPRQRSNYIASRPSSASPSTNGAGGSGKKRRNKKRKRDFEPNARAKRRRERQNAPASPFTQEPYIKDEPISPPPFVNVPEVQQYARPYVQQRPSEIDLISPRHAPQAQYIAETPRSGLRYEYVQPTSPNVVQVASPSAYRPVQRDTQDLRRVASLHYAQRQPSPARAYSPVGPYRTASMTYGDRQVQPAPVPKDNSVPIYDDQPVQEVVQYSRAERSRSPPRIQEYRDLYAERVSSPAMMPPPPPAPLRVVYDQFGNKYVAAEPAQAPAATHPPRLSAAPVGRRLQADTAFERAPSRSSLAYSQQPSSGPDPEPSEGRMLPPPPTIRQHALEPRIEYVDSEGRTLRAYNPRRTEPPRYVEVPTSPVYQQVHEYDHRLPPSQPAGEPTSPTYNPRSYSVRPELSQQPSGSYIRQTSVAPVQYVRQEAPATQMRAVSVMPGVEYGSVQPQRSYSQAYAPNPQGVRYVDAQGQEVFPREIRQVSGLRYQ